MTQLLHGPTTGESGIGDRPPLVISTSTLPVKEGDGVARFVLDLGTSVGDRFQVHILAPHCRGAPRREKIGNVDIRRFRYFAPARAQRLSEGGTMTINLRTSVLAKLQVPFFALAQVFAVWRLVQETGAKVVNSHWLIPQGFTTALVSRRLGVRHVLHVHAADVYLLRRMPLGRAIARFVVNRSDKILADGSHVRSALDDLIGRSSKASLRPMGVWTRLFQPGSVDESRIDHYVAFVGRFVEKKGIPYLLRAMVNVRRRHPGVGLVLIGSGPLEAELRGQVAELGLADAVTFTGPLKHDDVVGYLQRCRVACVPSIVDSRGETEGMPTVVVEAMAAGARVVGTAVDGIPDVLRHAENGWLCEPEDSEGLAKAIINALESPDGDQIRLRALETSSHHDWRQVGEEYADYLCGVAERDLATAEDVTRTRLSILQVTPYFPPDRLGGVGEMAAIIHQGLLDAGHRSEVLTSGTSNDDPLVHRVGKSPVQFVLRVWTAWRLARAFDVIHVHHGEALLLLAALRPIRRRPSVVVLFHVDVRRLVRASDPHVVAGQRFGLSGPREVLRRFRGFGRIVIDRFAYLLADEVTVETECLRQELADLRPQRSISVVPYGIEPGKARLERSPDPVEILYTGTAGLRKRTHLLPMVLKRVQQDHPTARLRVVGFCRDDEPRMMEEAKRLGVTESIEFMGGLSREAVLAYYEAAGLLLLPSAYEGLPLVLLEAMRAGACCVATRVSGHPEAIEDGVSGYLIPVDDIETMAAKCSWVLSNEAAATEIGDCASKTIESRFTVQGQIEAYLSLYRHLVTAPQR